MKILSLDLIAYGPFTNKSLQFPDGGANLHIVYGPNEAGKSCALRALSNALYGIPLDQKDGFFHPYEDLRIGLTVDAGGGPVGVVRRKGRANSLRRNDGTDSVFPPAEWAALLPVEERELFDRMFGVDHAAVAMGGKLILSSGSDLGGLLFAAAGGIDRLRTVQAELQKASEDLFTKRAVNRDINSAVAELKKALAAGKDALTLVGDYKHLRDAVEAAAEESRRLEKSISEASLEAQRLVRLQQAIPLVDKRRRRIEILQQHEGSRTLPAGFEERYQKAWDAVRESDVKSASLTQDIEEFRAKIDATPVTLAILERESEIEELYKQSASVKKRVDDRVRLEQKAADCRAEAAGLLESIGVRIELESAAELRIPDPARARIFTLNTSKKAVDQEVTASARDLRKAIGEQSKATEELAGLADAVDTGVLEAALALAPAGRDLEAEHGRQSKEAVEARSELDRNVSALPEWTGTLDELAVAAAPLAETVADFQNRFLEQASKEKGLMDERARLQGERDQAERDLRRIEQEQEVPTEQDLAASRSGRDSQWQAIRVDWLAGIETDGNARASSFEASVLKSDEIADRLRRESARVNKKAGLLVSLERLAEQLAGLEARIAAAQGAGAEMQAQWKLCWSAAGMTPRTPAEMQSWLHKRDAILLKAREVKQSEREADRLQEMIGAIRQALGGDSAARLPELMGQARRAISRQAELRQRKATLQLDAKRSERAIAGLEDRVAAANRTLSEWQAEWHEATEKLPVRRDATPEEVNVVVERIGSLLGKIGELENLDDRIEKLKRDEAAFLGEAVRLADAAGDPFAAAAELSSELQQNRTNRDLLKTLMGQLEEKKKQLARARDAAAIGNAELLELCKEAGAEDPAGLPDHIARASEKRGVKRELAELEDSLSNFAGKETIAHLAAEIDTLNVDDLPNRITQLERQIETFRNEKAERDRSLGAFQLELKQKEDANAAGQAAEDAEHLRSRIVNLTGEYVRLRLASRILANAVERYRDRNQGPLLTTAAKLFSQMTDGCFADLRVDWNERGEAELMGVRGVSQKQVGVEGMSEGTRDQLFLALRLAYVSNYCDSHGPAPFIADDVLMTFDDARATAALRALETLSKHTQVLLFTHHRHHLELAKAGLPAAAYCVHYLG